MQQKPDWIEKRQLTRRQAEQLLAGLSSAEMAVQPGEVLVHELLVHKVELEMQVEELRRAHISMEEARDRYVDLYDLAPVGYITISREGLISDSNLTGAAMLGVERNRLANSHFSKFVSPQDTDRWHRLFMSMMGSVGIKKQTFVLEMTRADASTFPAYLDCRRRESTDAPLTLCLTLIDIGKIKQAEAEPHDATIPLGGQ
jgi:PAS domain S-box-containing protein